MPETSFTVTTSVGFDSKFAGKIMDKHIRNVLDKDLGPAGVQRLNNIVSSWSKKPKFKHSVVKSNQRGRWELSFEILGPFGMVGILSAKELTPASIFLMLDQGRESGKKSGVIIKAKQIGVKTFARGPREGETVPLFKGGVTERPRIFWQNYEPKTLPGSGGFARFGGGGTRFGPLKSKYEVEQGAIKPRNFLDEIRKLVQRNAFKFARRGYNRAYREITGNSKKTEL